MKVLLVLIISFVFLSGCSYVTDQEPDAKKWATKMFPGDKVVSVSCARGDSDGDGYVSCQVNMEKAKMQYIECHWFWDVQCRAPKMRINQ